MPTAIKSGGNTFCETVCNPANNMKSSCDRICPGYVFSTSTITAGPAVYESEDLTPTWLIAVLTIVSVFVVLTVGFFGFRIFLTWRNKRKDFQLKHAQQEQGTELTLVLPLNDVPSPSAHMVNTDNTGSHEGENSNPNTHLLEEHNARSESEQTHTSISSLFAISTDGEPSSGYHSIPRKEGEPININTLKVRDANDDNTEVKLSLDAQA